MIFCHILRPRSEVRVSMSLTAATTTGSSLYAGESDDPVVVV